MALHCTPPAAKLWLWGSAATFAAVWRPRASGPVKGWPAVPARAPFAAPLEILTIQPTRRAASRRQREAERKRRSPTYPPSAVALGDKREQESRRDEDEDVRGQDRGAHKLLHPGAFDAVRVTERDPRRVDGVGGGTAGPAAVRRQWRVVQTPVGQVVGRPVEIPCERERQHARHARHARRHAGGGHMDSQRRRARAVLGRARDLAPRTHARAARASPAPSAVTRRGVVRARRFGAACLRVRVRSCARALRAGAARTYTGSAGGGT